MGILFRIPRTTIEPLDQILIQFKNIENFISENKKLFLKNFQIF